MVYTTRFDFFNAPIDEINVCANQEVLLNVLAAGEVYSVGIGADSSDYTKRGINDDFAYSNFDISQSVLFVPCTGSNPILDKANYMRVSFYLSDGRTLAFVRYYFINGSTVCDKGEEDDSGLLYFKLEISPDYWHTHVTVGGSGSGLYQKRARFYGGTLTRAAAITDGMEIDADTLHATPCTLPYDPMADEEGGKNPPSKIFATFKAVVQITGKNLKRSVMVIDETARTATDAIMRAQLFANSTRLSHYPQGETNAANWDINLKSGEFSVQGAYIIPADLCPTNIGGATGKWFPWNGEDITPEDAFANYMFAEVDGTGARIRVRASYENDFGAAGVGGTPYPSTRTKTVGTPFNRFDLTEYYSRGSNESPPPNDTTILSIFGKNSFNVYIKAGGMGSFREITNDFQIFSIVDPENEYIRANKTNVILSGLGGVGSIIGGAAAIASGAGAGVGVSMIAGGLTGVVKTIDAVSTARSAPDVLTGGGYGDVTAYMGGVYYEEDYKDDEQRDLAVRSEGVGRKIRLLNYWTLDLYSEIQTTFVKVNPLAAVGVNVRGVPKDAADAISTQLSNGVRVWYNADNFILFDYGN